MKSKVLAVIGLVFIIISQILLAQGFDFIQSQRPIDFAHWLMLIGSILCLAFINVFPKNVISTIATVLTILGVIAHIGMCTIDFVLWAYGDDFESRNAVISHLVNTPSIHLPFMIVGPSLFYAGLATYSWQFFKEHTLAVLITLFGSGVIGIGQMILQNRIYVVIGCLIFAMGLITLTFRDDKRWRK